MSSTPNLGLTYLESSQASPEVIINGAWDILDAAVGDPTSGAGGGSLTVDALTGITQLTFSGPAVSVSAGGTGEAVVTIDTVSGGTGAGSGNLTPYTHPLSPDATDDEFEAGTLDGKWTVRNLTGSASVTLDHGSISLLSDTVSGDNNLAVTEPIASPSAAWQYDFARVFCVGGSAGVSNSSFGAIVKAGTKYVKFGGFQSGSGAGGFLVQRLTTLTAFSSNPLTGGNWPFQTFVSGETMPMWLRLAYDGSTNIVYSASMSGYDNTWTLLWTEPVATFMGTAATDIGVNVNSANGTNVRMLCDSIRKTA
jgi:hypothetical protein